MEDAHILLVIPPPFFTKMPSIGVAYLSSFLKYKGLRASVCDLSVQLHNAASPELKRFWRVDCCNSFFVSEIADAIFKNFESKISGFVEEFLQTKTRVIGFSVNIASIYLANRIAGLIKERDSSRYIVFGGPGTFFRHPRELIQPSFADAHIIGEGEYTLCAALEAYCSRKRVQGMPNILLGKDLGRHQPVYSPNIPDVGSLPFPTFSEFNLGEYNEGDDYKPLPLLLSRGCIGRCSYCIDCIMWPKFRPRPPEQVMEEIRYHAENNGARAFEFNDLACNGDLSRLSRLCDLIIASGLKFDWVSYAIARKDMGFELLSKIKKAGCHTLIYGIESGSDRILRKMGKSYTAKEASGIIRLTHEAGICTNVNIILGFPGETEDDFNDTVSFIRDNRNCIDEVTNISGCTLFPESDLGRNKEKYGVHWQEGTDPMLFYDSNKLDRAGRNNRVARLLKVIDEIGLAKSIVNKPSLNPEVKAILDHEKNK